MQDRGVCAGARLRSLFAIREPETLGRVGIPPVFELLWTISRVFCEFVYTRV